MFTQAHPQRRLPVGTKRGDFKSLVDSFLYKKTVLVHREVESKSFTITLNFLRRKTWHATSQCLFSIIAKGGAQHPGSKASESFTTQLLNFDLTFHCSKRSADIPRQKNACPNQTIKKRVGRSEKGGGPSLSLAPFFRNEFSLKKENCE